MRSQIISDEEVHLEISREVRLWRAVLGQLIKDLGLPAALRKGTRFRARREAYAYFAPDNAEELRTLCSLAFVEYDVVRAAFEAGTLQAAATEAVSTRSAMYRTPGREQMI